MEIIKNIIEFIKKIFNKENKIKQIEPPQEKIREFDNSDFMQRIKVDIKPNSTSNVETLICDGDGLGIQTKLSY